MPKESVYKAQLEELGIYNDAYYPEIHQLCILERELSRVMKAWKLTAPPGKAPSALDPHYAVIERLRRDILAHRDALGLTPKAYKRLRGTGITADVGVQTASPVVSELLDSLQLAAEAAVVPESGTFADD